MKRAHIQESCELSVIVPISNMAGQLGSLSEWMLETSHFSMEVILVHDVRDNETGKEVKELVEFLGNPKVALIEGDFNGPGGARNAGLDIASGKWITFWDSDDSLNLKQVFSNLVNLENTSVDVIIGGFSVLDEVSGDRRHHYIEFENSFTLSGVALNPGIWRMIFRKKFLDCMQFQEIYMGEDQIFLFELRIWEKKVVFVEDSGYIYHKNRIGQLTKDKNRINELVFATRFITKLFFCDALQFHLGDYLILIRQTVTLLIHGKVKVKIEATFLFFRLLIVAALRGKQDFFRAVLIFLRYRVQI
jgi:glycosyltransferase involved in cell wall biosynthesis